MKKSFLAKSTLGLVILAIACLVFASVFENVYGSESSHRFIFSAHWFCAFWGLVAIAGFAYMFKLKLQRRHALFILHLAFGFILLGAGITHFWGREGYVYMREGQSTNVVTDDEGILVERLPFNISLDKFEILTHTDNNAPTDFVSHISVADSKAVVSMNHIFEYENYRFLQASYDEDAHGSVLLMVHDPWGITVSYIGYLFLLIGSLTWLFQRNSSFRKLLSSPVWHRNNDLPKSAKYSMMILSAVFVVYWIIKYINGWSEGSLPPVLRSPILFFHVVIIMISYSLLFIIAIIGIIALIRRNSQENLMIISRTLLYPAVILLAWGIFIGAVWANISWGNYWTWDPKEVWALITLLVYCFPVHSGLITKLQSPRSYHLTIMLSFLSVLITYFGVNFVLGGMHSYA